MTELKKKADNYYFTKYNRTLNIGEEERYKAITDAYITGAKENGIEWHDLRKDPNDLPEERKDVLVLYTSKEVEVKHLEWNKEWWGNGTYCSFEGVIAWCETPKFEGK